VGGAGLLLVACQPHLAGLTLDAWPASIDAVGQHARLVAVATDAEGLIGEGRVTFSSPAGELSALEVDLDAFGTARSEFVCRVADDPSCAGPVTVKAVWGSGAAAVTASSTVRVGATTGTGGGSGGGAGGGDGSTPCTAASYVGLWKRMDGFVWTITRSGCTIAGTGEMGVWSHGFTTPTGLVGQQLVVNMRRTNKNTTCSTVMHGTLKLTDETHFTMAFTSTDGHCDLVASHQESYDYVKQ
jgi:hypothetical protein